MNRLSDAHVRLSGGSPRRTILAFALVVLALVAGFLVLRFVEAPFALWRTGYQNYLHCRSSARAWADRQATALPEHWAAECGLPTQWAFGDGDCIGNSLGLAVPVLPCLAEWTEAPTGELQHRWLLCHGNDAGDPDQCR